MNKTITVERCGVVNVGYDGFSVNSEDIVGEVKAAIDSLGPKMNYNGDFAARVSITVELLGDMKAPETKAWEGCEK